MKGSLVKERSYAQDRELSWLKFNERVLDEADDPSVPLLERLKFVSIFTSNLDEFFMIRVGSLLDLSLLRNVQPDSRTGLGPKEQLERVYAAVRPLYEKKTRVYQEIKESLHEYGVCPLDMSELEKSEHKFIKNYFASYVEPLLSPQIVDTHHPFPHIANKSLCIIMQLRHKTKTVLGILPLPPSLPELVYLPGADLRYIRMEKLLFAFADSVFPKYEVLEKNILCVTRSGDINLDDDTIDLTGDFRSRMKKLLRKRKRLSVVRVEANHPMSERFMVVMCEKFSVTPMQIYISDTALLMQYVFGLASKLREAQQRQLTYPPLKPADPADLDLRQGLIRQIKQRDALLFHPYESMNPFLQLLREAAQDANVLSIKMTIYRLARNSKLVDYLCNAAENGKDVTIIMELRARFDEQNNIDWSEKLEDAGCKIIYGLDQLKVHSKLCLITMKERSGVSYITQVGTGNYNEKTAELYTDLSLFTANKGFGMEAAEVFKNLSIGNAEGEYTSLLVAPISLKPRLLQMIDEEIAKGSHGEIFFKMNSLTDIDFIDKLAEASRAGVTVRLMIRGICCLLPGVAGASENITVLSIVGRFLEHSRIYSFGRGEGQRLYIASADLMTRNTERRIEVAAPVLEVRLRRQINGMLETLWSDNVKARVLQADGNYIKKPDEGIKLDAQALFLAQYENGPQQNRPRRSGGLRDFFDRLRDQHKGKTK